MPTETCAILARGLCPVWRACATLSFPFPLKCHLRKVILLPFTSVIFMTLITFFVLMYLLLLVYTCLRLTSGLEHKPHGNRDLAHLVHETAPCLKQCLEHRRPSRQKPNMTALHAHLLFSIFLGGLPGCMNFTSSQTLLRKHSRASCPKAQEQRGIQVASGHLAGADQKLSGAYRCCGLMGMPPFSQALLGIPRPPKSQETCLLTPQIMF